LYCHIRSPILSHARPPTARKSAGGGKLGGGEIKGIYERSSQAEVLAMET
jgi:hypothetical protein